MRMDIVHAWDTTVDRIGSVCRAGRRSARPDRALSVLWLSTTMFRSVRIADNNVRYADIGTRRMSPPKAWVMPTAMTVEAMTIASATTIRATWASAVTTPPSLACQHLRLRLRDERVRASGRRCPRVRR